MTTYSLINELQHSKSADRNSLTTAFDEGRRWLTKRFKRTQTAPLHQPINQSLAISSVSLGMATTAFVVPSAAGLAAASLPLSLFVFAPTMYEAYYTVRDERRINNSVLATTRLGVCLLMNFYGVAALDAFLHSLSRKWHERSQTEWRMMRNSLSALLAEMDVTDSATQQQVLAWLDESAQTQANMHKRGSARADQLAPLMFATFFATLPLYGANRAGAFLMTSFGAHTHTLSPTTVRDCVNFAGQHGIFVRDLRGLESVETIETIIIDIDILQQLTAADTSLIAQLQAYAPNTQLVVTHQAEQSVPTLPALTQSGGAELVEIDSPDAPARIITERKAQGRRVCYIGNGANKAAMAAADLAIGLGRDALRADSTAHIIVFDANIEKLAQFFAIAGEFNTRQAFNLRTPIWLDITDITTTVLIHFGLFYSVLFNYSGLLISTFNTRRPFLPAPENPDQ